MNMGIEDAWVFANLVRVGGLAEYHAMRHPVDQKVVREVEFFTRMIASNSPVLRFARRFVLPIVARTPASIRIKRTVTGLDHDLPNELDPPDGAPEATSALRHPLAV